MLINYSIKQIATKNYCKLCIIMYTIWFKIKKINNYINLFSIYHNLTVKHNFKLNKYNKKYLYFYTLISIIKIAKSINQQKTVNLTLCILKKNWIEMKAYLK